MIVTPEDASYAPPEVALRIINHMKKEKDEMYSAANKQKRLGHDRSVYDGIRVGMKAMKVKEHQQEDINVNTSVSWLSINRLDQRIFDLPHSLDEGQASNATLILNGLLCRNGVDYTICKDTLNWIGSRKLRATDGLAVRYSLFATPEIKIRHKIKVTTPRIVATWEGPGLEAKNFLNRDLREAVPIIEDEEAEVEVFEDYEVTDEEEDMMPVEEGVNVWHRMTSEGPWVVIQRSTLKIRSSFAGGGHENTYNDSFVESAWTVQTEDQGMVDFPEVMLTTRPPKAEEKPKMSLWKKLMIGTGASALAFGIVNAQWIAALFGYGVAQ